MRKIILGFTLSILFILNVNAQSSDGQTIFEVKGCVLCHKKTADTIGPSLMKISTAYLGNGKDLLIYLKGQSSAIVEPSRAAVMQPQLAKISSLYESDIEAIARHIISANDREWGPE